MIFVNFDSIFFHGIEYCRIDEMKTIPWKKIESKLTKIIGQTLFFFILMK